MAKPLALPLAETLPHETLNIRFQLVAAANDTPYQCPGFRVPPGASVTLRTVNGTSLNVGAIFVSDYPDAFNVNGGATAVPPGADVSLPWPVDNTAQIWWSAQGSGDGMLVTIQMPSVG